MRHHPLLLVRALLFAFAKPVFPLSWSAWLVKPHTQLSERTQDSGTWTETRAHCIISRARSNTKGHSPLFKRWQLHSDSLHLTVDPGLAQSAPNRSRRKDSNPQTPAELFHSPGTWGGLGPTHIWTQNKDVPREQRKRSAVEELSRAWSLLRHLTTLSPKMEMFL